MVDALDLVANQQRAFSPTLLHLDWILGWQNWIYQGCQGYQGARGTTGTQFFADQLKSPFPTRMFSPSWSGCADLLVNPKWFSKV